MQPLVNVPEPVRCEILPILAIVGIRGMAQSKGIQRAQVLSLDRSPHGACSIPRRGALPARTESTDDQSGKFIRDSGPLIESNFARQVACMVCPRPSRTSGRTSCLGSVKQSEKSDNQDEKGAGGPD
jgi:hypothetical protein